MKMREMKVYFLYVLTALLLAGTAAPLKAAASTQADPEKEAVSEQGAGGALRTCRAVIAIQHMADTLDMKLCVKGIATQDQFEFCEEIGIFKGQGPLIGLAMPLEELKEYVQRYGLKKGHD